MKRIDGTPAAKLTLYSEMAQFTSAVDALYGRLGLTVGDTDLQKRALNTLLCQLVAYPKVQRIGLRSGNFTDNPLGIGYRPFKAVFDALTRYGFITIVRRGSYSRRKDLVATGSGVAVKDVSEGLQTRFEPTPDLIGFIQAHGLHAGMIRNTPGEVIILKDQNGNCISYEDTPKIKRMRANLKYYNGCLAQANITFDYSHCIPLERIDHTSNFYHRVFNRGNFDLGGRYYGPWWVKLPRVLRPFILIDGKPVVELDYDHMMIQLLYRLEGSTYKGDDAYVFPGYDFPRETCKEIYFRVFNCTSHSQLSKSLRLYSKDFPVDKISGIVASMKEYHAPISKHILSDSGLMLHRMEASISENIITELLNRGIIVLCVHDAFYVIEDQIDILDEIMNKVLILKD